MKQQPLHILLLCFAVATLLTTGLASCTDTAPEATPVEPQPEPEESVPDYYLEKIRTQPYPQSGDELFVNPVPFIVPQGMKSGERLQFCVADNEDFQGEGCLISSPVQGCFYNLHQTLSPGTWYWRFRSTDADGGNASDWSDTYRFTLTEAPPSFVTPSFDTFMEYAPRIHPRLYCFLNARIDEARQRAASHPEYKALTARANAALQADLSDMHALYGQSDQLRQWVTYLYHAYLLTEQEAYIAGLRQLLRQMAATPPTDTELLTENFTSTNIALAYAAAYDLLYTRLSEAERTAACEGMMRVLRFFFKNNCGYQENHLFDNHFWQQNMRILFQCAFLLYDKSGTADEVLPMLQYYYELWTARAPASGFNCDGLWHNGTGYFEANVKTLAYMPALLSYITRCDFLQHPWYRNAGQALAYSFPPGSRSNGFGDNSEKNSEPNRLTVAFADFLAKETGDAYAGWYTTQCSDLLAQDYELRLYRMATDRSYPTTLPDEAPHLRWYQDVGEVAIHSDLSHTDNDLALSFRSSSFGSGSHTTASQNAFNLLYRGADVYRSSGYYQAFADAHNLMSYRHSRAHNTILVNGIGQPYTTRAYGQIREATEEEGVSYAVGDASHAYCGISDDPMWQAYFEAAGITQTPENGFGETPLSKYLRHVMVLHPDQIVLIYDELEATEPACWDWLLHSPDPLLADETQQMVSSHNADKRFIATTQLYSSAPLTLSVTDQFRVPPALSGPQYPNQWHFTARAESQQALRVLAIIQVKDETEGAWIITRPDKNHFRIGSWSIEATLDPNEAPGLKANMISDE